MSVEQQSNEKPKTNPYMGILFDMIIVMLLNGLVFPNMLRKQIIDTDYGTFVKMIENGKVKQVKIEENSIYFSFERRQYRTYLPDRNRPTRNHRKVLP